MKTKDVKLTKKYLHKGEEVSIIKRIKPRPNRQFGEYPIRFLLSSGEEVIASELAEIENN